MTTGWPLALVIGFKKPQPVTARKSSAGLEKELDLEAQLRCWKGAKEAKFILK
jgi:hypothetical protein